MKKLFLLVLAVNLVGCKAQMPKNIETADVTEYGNSITAQDLKTHLYTFASDEFMGRETGTPGQKMAAEYLKDYYMSKDIPSPLGDNQYYQIIPSSYFDNKYKASENVVAYIKGSTFPEEVLVLSAHLDHVGVDEKGNVFNGADDDGSGNVAILEIAEAFKQAVEDGYRPKRSILFLHVTAEEKGLLGSQFYSENPIFPLENTIANLNIDMIGRVDEAHEDNRDYIYLIGSDMLSTELHQISEKANEEFVNIDLDYRYNGKDDPNRFYYRSDHYNFAKHDIPVIFYFNGVHEDYHRITDSPDKIQYDLLERRAKLIFYTAWKLANRDNPPSVDKPTLTDPEE